MSHTLGDLASRINATLHGDPDCLIEGVAALANASKGTITFLADRRLTKYLKSTRASAVILQDELLGQCPVAALVTDNPYAAYARIASYLHPAKLPQPGVHPSTILGSGTCVDESASIGPGCVLGDGAVIAAGVRLDSACAIGSGVVIGADSHLCSRVTICDEVRIGQRAVIQPGAVIGSDGFGMASENGRWIKVPQLGGVCIGDDVEIGANTTIDRGTLDDTVVEDGVKIDNLVQVAHNVRIGAHTAIAGCTGISGSTLIGRHCKIGGGVGIVGHLRITDHVVLTGMSLVTRSISSPGVYSSGVPVQGNARWNRNCAHLRSLDRLARRLKMLDAQSRNRG